ncbi:MAG: hypothetical protein LBV64_04545 [Mediterranea sp.]|jgi:hypothetical protein|nr:hypothetical protein [Mediterranea sp.]
MSKTSGYEPVYVSPKTYQYTSYQYPQMADDSTIIAVKSSLRDINSLVALKDGKEKRLSYIGRISSRIVLKHHRVYWTEYVPGIRWAHENYSVVKYYDLETKRIVTLTPHGRYLSPSVDAAGKTVAVSYVSESGVNQIVLIDANTGDRITHYDIPGNAFVKETAFGEDNSIIAVMLGEDGMHIRQLDRRTNLWKELLNAAYVNITAPVWRGGKLFFESGLNGINNIYCLDTKTLECYRLTLSRFGAFSPALSADGKRLFYVDYQAKGHRIVSESSDSLDVEVADFTRPYRFTLAEAISRQEQFNLDTAKLLSGDFNPKPYRRMSHLLKVHSWAPFFYDVNNLLNLQTDDLTTAVEPGAMILSQNTLNTAITQLGWYYAEGKHHGKLAFTYTGWYPVIRLNADYGGEAFNLMEAQAYIPFNLTRNHYISGWQPSVTYYYNNNRYQQYQSGKFCDFQYLLAELTYYRYRERSVQDIFPRWGGRIRLQHLRMPFNTENYGSLYAAQFTGYLPGLIPNNGFMLRFGYQYQNVEGKALYIPMQLVSAPRGHYYNYTTYRLLAFKSDYSFNIFHPDCSIGWLAYIKRIRSNVFYDYSLNQAGKGSNWTMQSSYGTDVIFDWNALQTEFPLSTGIRVIKPVQDSGIRSELLFSISF